MAPLSCRIQMATVYFKGKVNKLYFFVDAHSLRNNVGAYCCRLLTQSQRNLAYLQVLPVFCSKGRQNTHILQWEKTTLVDIFKQLVLFKYRARVGGSKLIGLQRMFKCIVHQFFIYQILLCFVIIVLNPLPYMNNCS